MFPVRILREDLQCHRAVIERSSVSHSRCDPRHGSHHSARRFRIHRRVRNIKINIGSPLQYGGFIAGPVPQAQILDPENLPSPDPDRALTGMAMIFSVWRRVISLTRCGQESAGYTYGRNISRAVHDNSVFFFSIWLETAAFQSPASSAFRHPAVSPPVLITNVEFSCRRLCVDHDSPCHISTFFRIFTGQSRQSVPDIAQNERITCPIASGDPKLIHPIRSTRAPGEALTFQQNLTGSAFRPALLSGSVLPDRPHLFAALSFGNSRISAPQFQPGGIDVLIGHAQ